MRNSLLKPFLAALFLCAAVTPVTHGGEGKYVESTGEVLVFKGYQKTAANIYKSPVIPFVINRAYRKKVNGVPTWHTHDLGGADLNGIVSDAQFCQGLFENVPSSRLKLGLGDFVVIQRSGPKGHISKNDRKSMVSTTFVMEGARGFGGQRRSTVNGHVVALEGDLTVRLGSGVGSTTFKSIMAHEFGHAIGANHSFLCKGAKAHSNAPNAATSIMSYGDRSQIIRSALLKSADVAFVSRLYPQSLVDRGPNSQHLPRRLSATTGTIRGHFIFRPQDHQYQAKGIYHANVLAINSNDKAVNDRVSGFSTSVVGQGAKNGFFLLDGLAPGRYTVICDPGGPQGIRRGSPNPKIPGKQKSTGYRQARVTQIDVRGGETVDIGYVIEGETRRAAKPSWVDIDLDHSGAHSYRSYDFRFFDASNQEIFLLPQASAAFKGLIPSTVAAYSVHGSNAPAGGPSPSVTGLQPTRQNRVQGKTVLNPLRVVTVRWDHAIKTANVNSAQQPVVALDYQLGLINNRTGERHVFGNEKQSLGFNASVPLEGTRFTTFLREGSYSWQVLRRFNLSEDYAPHTARANFTVSQP